MQCVSIGANIYQRWCCMVLHTRRHYIIQISVTSIFRYWIFSYGRSNTPAFRYRNSAAYLTFLAQVVVYLATRVHRVRLIDKLWLHEQRFVQSKGKKKRMEKMEKRNKYSGMGLRVAEKIVKVRFDAEETKIGEREGWAARDSGERSTWSQNKKEIHLAIEREGLIRNGRPSLSRRKFQVTSLSFALRSTLSHVFAERTLYRDHFCLLCDKKRDRYMKRFYYMNDKMCDHFCSFQYF